MRRRTGEYMEERRISTSSACWHGLQRTHSWRGAGAPTGSLSTIGCNQINLVQIEQRMGLYQRPLCPVARLVATGTSFPGLIISFARCPCRAHCRISAGRRPLLCSRYTSLSSIIIVPLLRDLSGLLKDPGGAAFGLDTIRHPYNYYKSIVGCSIMLGR